MADRSPESGTQRYRELMAHAADGVVLADADGRIIDANRAANHMLGYARDALLSRHLTDIIHADDLARHPMAMDRLRAGETLTREGLLVRRDGTTLPVEVSVKSLPDGTLQGIFRDIRVRKETEDALVASDDRFWAIFEQSPFSIVLYRSDGSVLEANPAASRVWGLDADSTRFLVERYNILEDPQLDVLGHAVLIRTAFEGEPTEIPLVRYDPDQHPFATDVSARPRWIRGYAYPVKDTQGRVREVAVVHEDVTVAKEEEERRVQIEREMLRGQKLESLGVLAGGIAHDFNNLLTTILGNVSQAGSLADEGSSLRRLLDDAEVAGRHASELCAQLLAYSGRGALQVEAIDISSLVQEMTTMLRVSIPKSADLDCDLAVGLPATRANASQVRQIVLNLITNAADAVAEMGGDIAITTGTEDVQEGDLDRYVLNDDLRPGLFVYLEVTDTGTGMPPEVIERIFDPFYSTKSSGRGLGLSATLGILRNHGGTARVTSAVGRGTTFRVLFPVSTVSNPGDAVAGIPPIDSEDPTESMDRDPEASPDRHRS